MTTTNAIQADPTILAQQPLSIEYLEKYLRENTGRMLADSGDYYGRQYDRPMPSFPIRFTAWKPSDHGLDGLAECYPSMSLAHFLIENCAALPELQKLFDQHTESSEEAWSDDIESFFENFSVLDADSGEQTHYAFVGERGWYTYNFKNDLDQNFQFWLLVPEDELEDYQYSERGILVLRSHNGCDARDGFSRPFFLTLTGEPDYLRFPDLECSVYIHNIEEFPDIPESKRDKIEDEFCGNSTIPAILDGIGFEFDCLSDDEQEAFFRQRSTGKLLRVGAEIPTPC